MKLIKFSLIVLITILFIQCKNDEKTEVEEPQTFLCCTSRAPFETENIDILNLENTDGFIIPDVFSPNMDSMNDSFVIQFTSLEGLVSLEHISVIIYDLEDNIVFENINLDINGGNWFDGKDQNGEELYFGSYKYKVVIENEQTFVKYGYVCLVRNHSEIGDFDFSSCLFPDGTSNLDSVLFH